MTDNTANLLKAARDFIAALEACTPLELREARLQARQYAADPALRVRHRNLWHLIGFDMSAYIKS